MSSTFYREEYLRKHYERQPQDFSPAGSNTKVLVLGSGNPFPNPMRMGPAVAVIVNGKPYFVDCGEGFWRAIAHAVTHHRAQLEDVFALENIQNMFLTHLHCDHTIGLPSFFLSPYKFNAPKKKEVYGPLGTAEMVDHILKAYAVDIDAGWTRSGHNPQGWRADAHEVLSPGLVFEDENVRIDAFKTEHAPMDHCWAYRFTTQDRVVVVGGDGRYSESLLEAITGADLFLADIVSEKNLAHAPWGGELRDKVSEIKKYHLVPNDLVRLQQASGVGCVVLYHEQGFISGSDYSREALAQEVKDAGFHAELHSSIDGDIF